jgi:hypothetical protein
MAEGMGEFTTKSTNRKLVMDEVDLNDTEELIKYYEAMVETRDAL